MIRDARLMLENASADETSAIALRSLGFDLASGVRTEWGFVTLFDASSAYRQSDAILKDMNYSVVSDFEGEYDLMRYASEIVFDFRVELSVVDLLSIVDDASRRLSQHGRRVLAAINDFEIPFRTYVDGRREFDLIRFGKDAQMHEFIWRAAEKIV